ncbi:MAG: hypothetical protein K6F51_00480 [Acetatifactor sp.]|nr:hypothetical protein [Acetatifactor sp.]
MKEIMEILENLKLWLLGSRLGTAAYAGWQRTREALTRRAVTERGMTTDPGIDGILVTVGLCIIALLLCVVMKNSLSEFIKSIVASMTREATNILSGART